MVLTVDKVSKAFGLHQVLKDVSLTIDQGEILALMGPSGSGKTILLRCCCGLEKPDEGTILINDQPIPNHRSIGLVFQNYQLFPHFTVMQNIIEAPLFQKLMSKEEAVRIARSYLKKMNLSEKENAYPNTLSGGQKQRIAILRALILSPSLLCFDEPTSALDQESIKELIEIIQELKNNMAILLVTHDEHFADLCATRKITLPSINRC